MVVLVKSRIEDGIGILTLADEKRGNVLSPGLVEQAQAAHREFIERGVRVAVLNSEGPAFCSGRDPEVVRVPGVPPAGAVLIGEFEQSPVSWVAAVDAPVIGAGIHLMSTCVDVIAGPNARFRVPELRDGIYPRPVAAELARIIGPRRTMKLLLTAEALSASEAVAAGLVGELVPSNDLTAHVTTRAQSLLSLGDDLLRTTRDGWHVRFGTRPADEHP
ncbi:enoyl-CoA hydratase/carnithine racemase [Arthrobacter ginsengisoli]|uniref:Enoyl-CoA hydratase/carnithine racemase n=1 Tax=Arthrobacter ginsengisoli TaxID=1356565 RepID=A0ABU1UDJ3_9MICC|nr:enoyl-CoA hydratase/isomerase family protein [Arthrobacter ginsengisoli]MDR7083252.1 enoyl-CoA hydratase/carnithine racemase [Arthrobacter ginsengisoli]